MKIDNADARLMAQYDGELAEAPEHEGDDALKLEALAQISEAVRLDHEAEMEDALAGADPFASMWSAIERRISANGESVDAASEVEVPAASAPAADEGLGLWGTISAWLERYRSQMATGAVCAVAAAALVWFVRPPDKTVEYVEVRSNAPTAPATTLVSQPAELESLEVYDGSGVVLTIPSEDGDGEAATTVIWLSPPDDEESVEGPI